jgi:hypothetical protein
MARDAAEGVVTAVTTPPGRQRAPLRVRHLRTACFAIPALVLAASYAWLALDHGTLLLWNVIVHESGRYTLGQTVLYFSHFLREVPTAITYALFLLGVSAAAAPEQARAGALKSLHGWLSLALAGTLVAGALLLAARSHGWNVALQDLLQYRTRDDLWGYGTHWRYHWLGTLWFGAATALAPAVSRWLTGEPALRSHAFWTRAAWGWFLALTLVFGLSADVFLDARYAGHQAREIMTHGPVTLLLGIGVLLAVGASRAPVVPGAPGRVPAGAPPHLPATGAAGAGTGTERRPVRVLPQWISGLVVVVVPVYLAVIAVGGDVMEQGQSEFGLGAMVGAHYFEHALDYVLVLALLSAGVSIAGRPRRRRPHHE